MFGKRSGSCWVGMIALLGWVWMAVGFAQAQSSWEKIIDDGDPGYSETGNAWASWSSADAYGGSYRYLSHQGQNIPRKGTATWQVSVPYDGQYEVSVHFRQTVNRTTDADYLVDDGQGVRRTFVLNQATLPTGWHKLGNFSWSKGQIAKVVLDGTDDNQSDEADAVRWRFIGQIPPPPPQFCDAQAPGTYTVMQYASQVTGSGDWASVQSAQGAPDQKLASSPNVDAGETLTAGGFAFCTPREPHTITQVRVGVLAKTQYESGPYELVLALSALGKRVTFSQTRLAWVWMDITSARASWKIGDLAGILGTLGLDRHPGGKRDSDAWVDAFAVEIRYTSTSTCGAGQGLCGGVCVDLQSHLSHCGACDRACVAGQTCAQGVCIQDCPSGRVRCGGNCVDPQSDIAHCGACGQACQGGGRCENGACVAQNCAGIETLCDGACVDVQKSAAHCGGCGQGCEEEEVCEQGRCKGRCATSELICGGKCIDGAKDRSHCGACDRVCGQGEDCVMGRCAAISVCPPGSQRCGEACVDIAFDDWHCGGCGQRCLAGWSCLEGRCVEPAGGESVVRDGGESAGLEQREDTSDAEKTKDSGFAVRASGCLCGWSGMEGVGMWGLGFWMLLLYRRRRR